MSANLSRESTSSSDVSNVSNISTSSFVASHYNNLQEKGREARKESRIYYLRNFNNWIKSIFIGEILERIKKDETKCGINVLDIGCGKGGDLLKYHIGRIDHIVCTDIAETSLEQCKQRYNDMRNKNRGRTFTADFIHADSTRDRLKDKFQNRDIKFDLVSIQFSFHYCFESLPQAECMIRNASESLRPGGYFIGTTPDAFEIVKRLRNSDSHKFGNDVYSVAFDEEEYSDKNLKIPLFGTKYNFHLDGVVDCPEFLVYFPVLVEICKKYHLHLVFKERFDDYFRKHQSRDDLNLIRRMDGLECYSKGKNNLMGSKDDYKHCEEFISKLNSNEQDITQVGTISASEWEAITLYILFAFQKNSPDTSKPNKRQKV